MVTILHALSRLDVFQHVIWMVWEINPLLYVEELNMLEILPPLSLYAFLAILPLPSVVEVLHDTWIDNFPPQL